MTKRANQEETEQKLLFLLEKSFKAQLQHRPDNTEKIEDLQNSLEGTVAKEHFVQKMMDSL